jgi:hypothetical protein
MSENPWDALTSALGSELDTIRKSITNEFNSLGLGDLVDFVPHVYQLIRSMGGGDPLSLIRETAQQIAFGSGQALVAQALESFLSPMTDPVQRWQPHKQNLSEVLLTHWSTMDGRISQLYTTDQFRGPAANALTDQHEQIKQHGKGLHNQLLDSIQADTRVLGSIQQAIQEKSSEIARLGPVGPFAFLIALRLVPSSTQSSVQSPPQWLKQLEKDVKYWFVDPNPFDGNKPLLVRILELIADVITAIGLVELAALVSALALIIFSVYLLWLDQQPVPPPAKPKIQPQPVPTPGPVNSNGLNTNQQQELNDIIAQATQERLPFDQLAIEDMIKAGLDRKTIMNFLRLRVPNLQQSGANYNGHTLTMHVDMSNGALKQRAAKDKTAATSYPNEQVAQSATDYVIARSAILQDFIKNGAPGGEMEDTQCYPDGVQMPEDVQTLGYGYARPVGNKPPLPATQPMRCATVVLAKDANGNVFVLSSFPRPLFS